MNIIVISCRFLVWSTILLAGCAMRPTTLPTQSWSQPCDTCISGVENFAKVSPVLWRGAQPTEEGFRNLERAGAKTVIDLRHDSDDYEDFSMLGGTHLKYLRIPMRPWNPDQAQLVILMKVLERTLKAPIVRRCSFIAQQAKTAPDIASQHIEWCLKDGTRMTQLLRCMTSASIPYGFIIQHFWNHLMLRKSGSS